MLLQLPYHNYLHAGDVLLNCNRLFLGTGKVDDVPVLDFLALQIACIGEDRGGM